MLIRLYSFMQDQPRQITFDVGDWVSPLVWEDTGEFLTEDELRDVVEAYNLLLMQQFAAMIDFVE